MSSDWYHLLDFIRSYSEQTLALATLTNCEGSSYRGVGARLLVHESGEYAGSLSGGCLEAGIAKVAVGVIANGLTRIEKINTQPHFGCPGVLTVQIERIEPKGLLRSIEENVRNRKEFSITTCLTGSFLGSGEGFVERVKVRPRLILVGWTSDQEPLFNMAEVLKWECHRVVKDETIAAAMNRVSSEELTVCSAENLVEKFVPDEFTAVIIMSHHLATDLSFLKQVVNCGYCYIGLLGSRRRREKLLHEVGEYGMLENSDWVDSFYTPVGLDLGADHPSSIALAILSEIQAVFSGCEAGFLRDKVGKIHDVQVAIS